jgi:gliding motility-associated-like protein
MNTAQYTSVLQNPTFAYTEPGTYAVALVVKSDKGCMDTLVRPIEVGEDFGIYVPNAFTPNGDGLNDLFNPKGFGIVKYELNIYDRWGELMFHTTTFEEGWNGARQKKKDVSYPLIIEEGVYTWLINCTSVFGKSHELKGHVTLIK